MSIKSGFSDVDRSDNPDFFVDYLARKWNLSFSQAYKQRAISWLNLEANQCVLDVGCGVGLDVAAMAQQTGFAAGVDSSFRMITEAVTRNNLGSFCNGDVHHLPFASDIFDACFADKVFQHLPDPKQALLEMVRVTKPGGHMVIVDPDHDIRTVDTPYRDVTRRVFQFRADTVLNGGIAHEQYRRFQDAGLIQVTTEAAPWVCTDYDEMNAVLKFDWTVKLAAENGVISQDEGQQWLAYLQEAAQNGRFLAIIIYLITIGRKPVL